MTRIKRLETDLICADPFDPRHLRAIASIYNHLLQIQEPFYILLTKPKYPI
jgi:hypothetical protein